MSVEQAKRTSTYRTMTSAGRICPFPLWLRTWFSWWLPPCWRTSISISSVISAIRSSHWKRQAGWKPLSCILSACQQNGCALEGRTFWTYIPQFGLRAPLFYSGYSTQRFFRPSLRSKFHCFTQVYFRKVWAASPLLLPPSQTPYW